MTPPEKVYFMHCSILWTVKGEENNKNKENGYVISVYTLLAIVPSSAGIILPRF